MTNTSQDTPQPTFEGVDPFDPADFVHGPPHEKFAELRATCPVQHVGRHDGGGDLWSVTRHADVTTVSKSPDVFSSEKGGVLVHRDQTLSLDIMSNLLLYKDPPAHTKYRKILQTAFVPNTVAKLEPEIRARVTRLIDGVIERGTADFTQDIAVPLTLGVLAELMGVPEEDVPKFQGWSHDLEQAMRDPTPNAGADTFVQLGGYLFEQIQRQIAEGGDSLVTRLRAAEVDGDQLNETEIVIFFGLLVFAGNDTTRNTASGGLKALLEHPEQLQALRDDPSKIPAAIEEILRWTTVVNYFVRTATQDTELAGCPIHEGDKVMMWYTSASRDEQVFDDPQRFDITRVKPDHKAFGGGGRHFCLGSGLARLELRVLFEEIVSRFDDLALAGEVEHEAGTWANQIASLPISFEPAAPVG